MGATSTGRGEVGLVKRLQRDLMEVDPAREVAKGEGDCFGEKTSIFSVRYGLDECGLANLRGSDDSDGGMQVNCALGNVRLNRLLDLL